MAKFIHCKPPPIILIGETIQNERSSRDIVTDHSVNATLVECPTCGAWVGWACEGAEYGYHAAGYHARRIKLARLLTFGDKKS